MADQVIDNADDGVAGLSDRVNEVGQGIEQVGWADVFGHDGRLRSVVTLFWEVLDNNDLPNDQASPMVGQLVGFWIRLQEQGRRLLREGGRSEGELRQAIRVLIEVSQFARHVEQPLWDRCFEHSQGVDSAYRETLRLLMEVAKAKSAQSANSVFEALEELKQSETKDTHAVETAFTALANLTRLLDSSENDIRQARRVLELFNFLRHKPSGRNDNWVGQVADFLVCSYMHLMATGNYNENARNLNGRCLRDMKAALKSARSSALSQDREYLQRWVESKQNPTPVVVDTLVRLVLWRSFVGDGTVDAHGMDETSWTTAQTVNDAVLALCDWALVNQQHGGRQVLRLLQQLPGVDVADTAGRARNARKQATRVARKQARVASEQARVEKLRQQLQINRNTTASGSTSLFWSFWEWVWRFVKGCRDALFAT